MQQPTWKPSRAALCFFPFLWKRHGAQDGSRLRSPAALTAQQAPRHHCRPARGVPQDALLLVGEEQAHNKEGREVLRWQDCLKDEPVISADTWHWRWLSEGTPAPWHSGKLGVTAPECWEERPSSGLQVQHSHPPWGIQIQVKKSSMSCSRQKPWKEGGGLAEGSWRPPMPRQRGT